MKKQIKKISVLLLAFTTSLYMAVPINSFAAGTKGSPVADDVEYYTTINDEGETVNTGIKRIVIDPDTYTNISRDPDLNPPPEEGGEIPTIQLTDATVKKIAEKYIFPKWGVVAEGIFRNQANQLVTIEGTGMMSSDVNQKESFDRHFSYGRPGVGYNYKEYDWALSDLASTLGAPPSKSGKAGTDISGINVLQGEVNDDEVVYSGIYPINTLKDARTLVGKSLRACADDDNLTVDDFLGNEKDKSSNEYRLPELDTDKVGKGYCSVVTCVNRAGASFDYDYNTFGLAVYDIDITPMAARNVKYITAAQEYADAENPLEEAQKAGVKGVYYNTENTTPKPTFITNQSPQESSNSVALAQNISETTSISTTDTFQFAMSQTIGTDFHFGSTTDFFNFNLHLSTSFQETWGTMKTESSTHTEEENRTVTTQINLPGHTTAAINQTIENITAEEDYQQPVVISYKVAIFAMSGDYYNGSLGVGMISSNRYDKQWMSVIFDGTDAAQQNGCLALSSLYNRVVTNAGIDGYDGVRGNYRNWCDKGAWKASSDIGWNQIAKDIKADTRPSHNVLDDGVVVGEEENVLEKMATNLQFAETATTFHANSNAMTTSLGEVMPLYDLASVGIEKDGNIYDNFVINVQPNNRQDIYLNAVNLKGFDGDDVEFYGFNSVKGKWVLCDNDGHQPEGVAVIDDAKKGQYISISQDVGVDEEYTLKWVLDEDQTIVTKESPEGMSVDAIRAVPTPTLIVKTVYSGIDVVELSGEYRAPYNEAVNLNDVLNVNVFNGDGKSLSVPVYWEDNNSKGINVSDNGDVTFTVPGNYRVRAYCLSDGVPVSSDWLQITALESATLNSLDLDTSDIDEDDLNLTEKHKTRSYDLNSFVSMYDQNGDEWSGTPEEPMPEVAFSIDESDKSIAEIDDRGILTVKKGGRFKVTASATTESGKTVSDTTNLRITEDSWLCAIEFNKPAVGKKDLILSGPDDQITIGGLKDLLSFYDQNGYDWKGEKPKVTFDILERTDGAEIKSGGNYSFFAYKPGRYTIQPEVAGYQVNPVVIEVTEAQSMKIVVSAPSRQKLIGDNKIELELERFLNAVTPFGETWKGDIPEMYFQLDDGVTGAEIVTETVKDSRTGEDSEIHKFVCDTPGGYAVHVSPKQASAYSDKIDDIIINVVRYEKVARLGLSDISEESGQDLTVNIYEGKFPTVNLSQFLKYYNEDGEELDPSKQNVVVPNISYEIVEMSVAPGSEEAEEIEVSEKDAKIADGNLIIYSGGIYLLKVKAPGQEDVIGDVTTIYAPDSSWKHEFGDWEVTKAPTCTEAGLRTKTCQEEGCSFTIVDSIPATGHRWGKIHDQIQESLYKQYAVVRCKDCYAMRSSTKITIDTNEYINTRNSTPATCETDGVLEIGRTDQTGYHFTRYIIPATGHHWSDNYISDEEHAASCDKDGAEWIECTECKTVKSGSTKRIPNTMDSYPTDPETGEYIWETVVDPTCTKDGYKEVRCEKCGKPLRVITPATGHDWDDGKVTKEPTCAEEGVMTFTCKKDPSHTKTKEIPKSKNHKYGEWVVIKEPTEKEEGLKERTCELCGNKEQENIPIAGKKTITKADITGITAKTYTGKEVTQAPVVKLDSATLKLNTDYTVTYENNKNVGTATVTITGKGDYSGELSRTFEINPKGAKLKRPVAGKKAVKVRWKKQSSKMSSSRIMGYQVQYSTKKTFKSKVKTVNVKGYKKTYRKIKGLKAKKTYYVRVRTYMKVGGKKYYSPWSAVKKVKTK